MEASGLLSTVAVWVLVSEIAVTLAKRVVEEAVRCRVSIVQGRGLTVT